MSDSSDSPPTAEEDPRTAGFHARPSGSDIAPPKTDLTQLVILALIEPGDDAQLIVDRGIEHFLSASGRLERHAGDAIIIKVQELCDRLPQPFRDERPDVPWSEIRGSRNRIGHNYPATDYRIIWVTLKESLPALIARVR